jgi:uncharacterized protein
MIKNTLVIGASLNEYRYSNICVKTLSEVDIPVTAIGLKAGLIGETPVLTGQPALNGIHTVTLYLGSSNQTVWYDYILDLKPKRVIFNPGAENPAFEQTLQQSGIETLQACTIVMAKTGAF